MKKVLASLLLLVSASVVLAACTPESTVEETEVESMPASGESMQDAVDSEEIMMEDDETMMVTMDTGEFFFAPKVLEAKPGQTVEITLTNSEGEMPHDFVIDELNVQSEEIEMGDETVVTFTVPESAAGQEYEFYCSVGEHRENGMVGTLVVS
ncbi:MAG: cupredoxin domain-containing protein, partial [Microgenomates group bacterium]